MLFKIALKNIKKSFKDYFIYFLTLCIAVACFYMFNSIDSQAALIRMNKSTLEIMELLMKAMSVVSVIVAVVLGFLIVHANRFLINRRKKEFGIYLTLGMGKGGVSAILLWETVFIGLISLAAGLAIGVFGSQLMSIFTAKMFRADMSAFHFIFSKDAFIKSCIYYGIIYGAVLILNTFAISRFRLISLMRAKEVSEKSPMRNNILSVIVFFASVLTLIYAHIHLAKGVLEIDSAKEFVMLIILVIVSTFFIFWSLSGFVLNILRRSKKIWYKSTNCFVFRQLAGKINTTVVSMTLVCLMMFFAIVSLGGSLSLKNALEKQVENNTPVDFNVFVYNQNGKSITSLLDNIGFDTDKIKDTAEVNVYNFPDLSAKVFFADTFESVASAYSNVDFDDLEDVIGLSEYNALASVYGQETFELADNEYVCVADFDAMADLRNSVLINGNSLNIGGKTYTSKYTECKPGFVQMSGSNINTGIIVVPDSCDFSRAIQSYSLLAGNYNAVSEDEKKTLENQLTSIEMWRRLSDVSYYYETKTEIFNSSVRLMTVVLYVAIYIGIIFLMASAALLSLNQLTDSEDSIRRYEILRKIGCDERMIDGTLFKQTAVFFGIPLAMAVIHSVIGFKFFASLLIGVKVEGGIGLSIIFTMLIIGGIYSAYFLATFAGSRRIVRE